MAGVQEKNTKRDDGLEKLDLNDQNVPNNIKVQQKCKSPIKKIVESTNSFHGMLVAIDFLFL
jgi:hypothetical protein